MEPHEGNGKACDQRAYNFRFRPFNHFVDHHEDYGLQDADFKVFVTLWRKADFQTNVVCGITIEQLASDLKKSRSAFLRGVRHLIQAGYLIRRRGGKNVASSYTLTVPVDATTDTDSVPSYCDTIMPY